MNERTVLLGGRFEIIPVLTGGTTLRAEVPVPPDGNSRTA
jgi:signal transduction histidine kinase